VSITRIGTVPVRDAGHSLGIRATHSVPAGAVCHHRRMRPSVLIVDDHEDFRRSARALLEAEGFAVVGEAGDGAEAIAKARVVRPDVVLVDIQLPDLDGFAVAERIAAGRDPPVVVLISSRDASVYRSRLASTSARGFIAKSQLSGEALADLVA
jgi:DNA-binding NarL/FixJ family response regulator